VPTPFQSLKRVVFAQSGTTGAGAPILLENEDNLNAIIMGTPSGGEITTTPIGARDVRTNRMRIVGMARTGLPGVFKIPLTFRKSTNRKLTALEGMKTIGVAFVDGELSNWAQNYRLIWMYGGCRSDQEIGSFSKGLVNNIDGSEDGSTDIQYPANQTGMWFIEGLKLLRSRILSATGLAVNDAVLCSFPIDAGEVAGVNTNRDGSEEWAAISVADGSNLSHLYWSIDGGATMTDTTLTGFTNFIGSGITKCGDNLIVSGTSTGGGTLYMSWSQFKAGTVTNFTRSNLSAGTVVNAVRAINDTTAIACGTSGNAWISNDNGVTWTAFTSGTANSLTDIAVASDTLQWLGGASGTLIRRRNGVCDTVTVSGISTTAINALAVPPGTERQDELFVGSAGGVLYATANGLAQAPTWTTPTIPDGGTGAIDALAFAGRDGAFLYIVQTNGSTQSRILRDIFGGRGGSNSIEIVGSYTSPANSSINAIITNEYLPNTAYAFGDANSSNRYIEKIQP
jgi:hypothetical protein